MSLIVPEKAINAITPKDISRYLDISGWTRIQTVAGARSIAFERNIEGTLVKAVIPSETLYKDFLQRTTDLVRLLSEIEQREPLWIVQDILHPDVDRLQIKVLSDIASDGSIPLAHAARLVQAMKELIIATACTEENPQPFYRRATKNGTAYADKCRFGQTQRGSFVVTIESQLPSHTTDTEPIGVPFGRRVFKRIQVGLATVHKAIEEERMDALEAGYKEGLNANMAEALLNSFDDQIVPRFEYSVRWASSLEAPEGVPSTVALEEKAFKYMESMARKWRGAWEATQREITGKVVKLSAYDVVDEDDESDGSTNRTVTIHIDEPGQIQNVVVSLGLEEYKLACDAHRDGKSIKLSGFLERTGKQWRLMNPDGFEMI